MRVRNPEEPTSYVQVRGRGGAAKKFKSRGLTIYGATPDKVMEIIEKAIGDAAGQEPTIRRAKPICA